MSIFSRKAKPVASKPVAVRSFALAQTTRLLSGWKWDGGFSAQEIRGQLATIRSRSREMAKNNPHMKRYLQLFETNVVGEGFRFKSTPHDGFPGSDSWKLDTGASKFIEYHWKQFCTMRDLTTRQTYCDATGRKTVAQMDRLNAKTWARDGEYFIIPQVADNPYGISFRIIRPDACDETYFQEGSATTNPVYCGVELDRISGSEVAYYFNTTDPQSGYRGLRGHLVRISASRVIHGFTQEDEDQTRGIPLGHASLIKLKMMEEYDRAEITAAREEACSTRSYESSAEDPEGVVDLTDKDNADTANALVAETEPGQKQVLPIGWTEKIHTPQHPNRELTAFKDAMTKDVFSGFNVEYSNGANNWQGVSFSSVRQGTISERDGWKILQADMISQNKCRMFLMWLDSFLSLRISGNYPKEKQAKFSEHKFLGRRWMWVDPARDMAAAKMAVDNGWRTNTEVTDDLGGDFDDNLEETKRENDSRDKAGIDAPLRLQHTVTETMTDPEPEPAPAKKKAT